MKRLLVTGAGGLLGRELPALCGGSGVEVLAIPGRSGASPVDLCAVDFMQWPPLRGVDAVIHCAALSDPGQCERDPATSAAINVEVPERLAEACRHLGLPLLHVSSDWVFDGSESPYTEDSATRPCSVYGEHKAASEQRVLAAHADALVVRLPPLLAIDERRGLVVPLLRQIQRGESPALFEDEWRQPMTAADAARLILQCLGRGVSGRLQLAGPDLVSRHQLGCLIVEAFGLSGSALRRSRLAEARTSPRRPTRLAFDRARMLALGLHVKDLRASLAGIAAVTALQQQDTSGSRTWHPRHP